MNLLIKDKVWDLVVADGKSDGTREGRGKIQRAVKPQLQMLEVTRHLSDTDAALPVDGGSSIYKADLKIPSAGKTFVVIAKVVTNPGKKVIETKDVKLYCQNGELALSGKEFGSEEAARHAIQQAINQEKVIMYKRNGETLAKQKKAKK